VRAQNEYCFGVTNGSSYYIYSYSAINNASLTLIGDVTHHIQTAEQRNGKWILSSDCLMVLAGDKLISSSLTNRITFGYPWDTLNFTPNFIYSLDILGVLKYNYTSDSRERYYEIKMYHPFTNIRNNGNNLIIYGIVDKTIYIMAFIDNSAGRAPFLNYSRTFSSTPTIGVSSSLNKIMISGTEINHLN
jgi:hypothetical protein